MNIKISKSEHDFLQEYVLESVLMGSKLYGVDTDKSDTDLLCIYSTPIEWTGHKFNAFPNIHQFQYTDTEQNIDYIYTSEDQFYWNLFSGDSTINADICLFSEKAKVLGEQKLYILRTYKIIKAYLGFAKRDLVKGTSIKQDKLCHGTRSTYIAYCLLNNELPELTEVQNIYAAIKELFMPVPESTSPDRNAIAGYVKNISLTMNKCRDEVNELYNNNSISSYPDFTKHSKLNVTSTEPIDSLLCSLLNSNNTREFKY